MYWPTRPIFSVMIKPTLRGRPNLLRDNPTNFWITMPQRINGDSGSKVQVPTIFHIPYIAPFSLHHHWWWAYICAHHVGAMLPDHGKGRGIRWRIGIWQGGFFLFQYQQVFNSTRLQSRLTIISSFTPFMGVGVGTAVAVALRLYILAPKVGAADIETVPSRATAALREMSRKAIVAS